MENRLLRRREIKSLIPQAAGRIARTDAVQKAAQALNVDVGIVHLVSLSNRAGTNDVEGMFYVYPKSEDAEKHIPRHMSVRMLTKDERKKISEAANKGTKTAKAK